MIVEVIVDDCATLTGTILGSGRGWGMDRNLI
jgi:hypothetical protein